MTHPQGGQPGHPEPAPVPFPDPEPPQPIPPDEPIPTPEPPHEWPPHADTSSAAGPPAADFVAAPAPDDRPTATIQAVPAAGWQQPPPSGPWYAQHEAPGEWQTQPPEHLAWQHSPPAQIQPQPEPIWATPQQPGEAVPPPAGRRGALWVSLALVATLLLCGGGAVSAYLLLRDADNPGSPDPATAVNRFLTAVYSRQDAAAADDLVCREARDQTKINERIREIKAYSDGYQEPVYRWADPTVASAEDDRAVVSVRLSMSTSDEKTAQQDLEFTVIRKTGWLVCEVTG